MLYLGASEKNERLCMYDLDANKALVEKKNLRSPQGVYNKYWGY